MENFHKFLVTRSQILHNRVTGGERGGSEGGWGWGSGAERGLYLFTDSNKRKERSCKLESLLTFLFLQGGGGLQVHFMAITCSSLIKFPF